MADKYANDPVIEHGNWCLDRMVGTNNPVVPEHRWPLYAANERRILGIMDERRRFLQAQEAKGFPA